jgi:hypothetical protein
MCRSIKTLRRPDEPPTSDEVHAAALQFVRKISGFRKPSARNQEAFERAVQEIAQASEKLLTNLAIQQSSVVSTSKVVVQVNP